MWESSSSPIGSSISLATPGSRLTGRVLRVFVKSCRSQASENQPGHGSVDEGFLRERETLVIFRRMARTP